MILYTVGVLLFIISLFGVVLAGYIDWVACLVAVGSYVLFRISSVCCKEHIEEWKDRNDIG